LFRNPVDNETLQAAYKKTLDIATRLCARIQDDTFSATARNIIPLIIGQKAMQEVLEKYKLFTLQEYTARPLEEQQKIKKKEGEQGSRSLKDYLALPMQRVSKYPLALKALLGKAKKLPQSDLEGQAAFNRINSAIGNAEKVAGQIDKFQAQFRGIAEDKKEMAMIRAQKQAKAKRDKNKGRAAKKDAAGERHALREQFGELTAKQAGVAPIGLSNSATESLKRSSDVISRRPTRRINSSPAALPSDAQPKNTTDETTRSRSPSITLPQPGESSADSSRTDSTRSRNSSTTDSNTSNDPANGSDSTQPPRMQR
jgi:hypothetical protein